MASPSNNFVYFNDKLPTVSETIIALLNGQKQIRIEAQINQTRVAVISKAIFEIFQR